MNRLSSEVLANPTQVVLGGDRAPARRRGIAFVASMMMAASVMLVPTGDAQAQNYRQLINDQSISARDYDRSQALRAERGRIAEVVGITRVEIENRNRVNFGAAAGAMIGSELGRRGGSREDRRLRQTIGGALGGLVGYQAQRRLTKEEGVMITVMEFDRRGNPTLTNIVQANDQNIRPGDFVMVTGSGRRQAVLPLDPAVEARLQAARAGVMEQTAPRRPGMR